MTEYQGRPRPTLVMGTCHGCHAKHVPLYQGDCLFCALKVTRES